MCNKSKCVNVTALYLVTGNVTYHYTTKETLYFNLYHKQKCPSIYIYMIYNMKSAGDLSEQWLQPKIKQNVNIFRKFD